jgi:hypothetical protein
MARKRMWCGARVARKGKREKALNVPDARAWWLGASVARLL